MNGTYYDYQLLATIRNAKYTQEEFAKMLDVTIPTLSRIENGRNASYEIIVKICQLLDIDSAKVFYSSRKVSLVT
ncbi:MAG: helix-turn-helix domain-containing protein [Pyrinomonadaceae bacterium]